MHKRNYVQIMIEQFAADDKNRTALKIFDGKRIEDITYNHMADKIMQAAGFFSENGLTGRHIALMGSNCQEWIISYFAIAASGNVVVPLNPALPKKTVIKQCLQADVSVICGDQQDIAPYRKDFLCVCYGSLRGETPMRLKDLAGSEQDATALLLFTSGTTGESKAVEITYANLESSLRSADGVFSEPEIHRIMTVLPMFHIAGIRGALSMLYRYKTLCIGRGIMYLFRDMPALSPDYILLVPLMVDSLVKLVKRTSREVLHKNYLGANLKRLCIGGATIDPDHCRFLMSEGFTIDSGYALSETTGVGTWGTWDAEHLNTIGKLSGELQCRIVDGELQLKGPAVMKGYYKDAEATNTVIEDGWFHTGDLGYCDADGYFYLTGRKKNLIVMPNGEKLNPEEVEQQFNTSDAIEECLIRFCNNMLCIEIYAKDENAASGCVEAYNDSMPLSYQIRRITFHKEPLKKTASGKLVRKEMKE